MSEGGRAERSGFPVVIFRSQARIPHRILQLLYEAKLNKTLEYTYRGKVLEVYCEIKKVSTKKMVWKSVVCC